MMTYRGWAKTASKDARNSIQETCLALGVNHHARHPYGGNTHHAGSVSCLYTMLVTLTPECFLTECHPSPHHLITSSLTGSHGVFWGAGLHNCIMYRMISTEPVFIAASFFC